jgi:hypothetical protein
MAYIATQHNPQGEFIDQATGVAIYGRLVALFLSWFVPITFALALAPWIWRRLRSSRSQISN